MPPHSPSPVTQVIPGQTAHAPSVSTFHVIRHIPHHTEHPRHTLHHPQSDSASHSGSTAPDRQQIPRQTAHPPPEHIPRQTLIGLQTGHLASDPSSPFSQQTRQTAQPSSVSTFPVRQVIARQAVHPLSHTTSPGTVHPPSHRFSPDTQHIPGQTDTTSPFGQRIPRQFVQAP